VDAEKYQALDDAINRGSLVFADSLLWACVTHLSLVHFNSTMVINPEGKIGFMFLQCPDRQKVDGGRLIISH
jgi:hypothetical protein